MFKNLKIGVRLGFGFGAILVLLVAISLIAVSSLGKVNGNLEKIRPSAIIMQPVACHA